MPGIPYPFLNGLWTSLALNLRALQPEWASRISLTILLAILCFTEKHGKGEDTALFVSNWRAFGNFACAWCFCLAASQIVVRVQEPEQESSEKGDSCSKDGRFGARCESAIPKCSNSISAHAPMWG